MTSVKEIADRNRAHKVALQLVGVWCMVCDGSGTVYEIREPDGSFVSSHEGYTCPTCKGWGQLLPIIRPGELNTP